MQSKQSNSPFVVLIACAASLVVLTSADAQMYTPMDVVDIKLDYPKLEGQKVEIKGFMLSYSNTTSVSSKEFGLSLNVDSSSLTREERRAGPAGELHQSVVPRRLARDGPENCVGRDLLDAGLGNCS